MRIGPVGFRIGSDWRMPIAELERLYAAYPKPQDGVADFTVRLFAQRWWRRAIRPSVMIGGDYMLPEAAPLPLAQGLLTNKYVSGVPAGSRATVAPGPVARFR